METTLGKRIVLHRKKLGLTQDKLAEALGVTAQAVSKWENDLSCPDISLLPKLAQLFGITTDELLGVASEEKTAKPILEGTVESSQTHTEQPDFEFNWKAGKRDGIFLAVFVLAVGALALISVLLNLDVSFWSILWPCAILGVGIRCFFQKFSFFGVACTLFGAYFLLENMTVTNLDVSWKLVFPILILLLGLTLLLDSFQRPKHSRWQMRSKDKQASHLSHKGNLVNEFSVDGQTFHCALHFGDDYRRVEMQQLFKGEVECSFGDLTLDLTECSSFTKDCHMRVDCSFGSTTILVPKRVQVEPHSSTAFAGIDIQGSPDTNTVATIHMDVDVSFGSITICYT